MPWTREEDTAPIRVTTIELELDDGGIEEVLRVFTAVHDAVLALSSTEAPVADAVLDDVKTEPCRFCRSSLCEVATVPDAL